MLAVLVGMASTRGPAVAATTQVQHEKRVYLAQRRLYVPRNQKLETGGLRDEAFIGTRGRPFDRRRRLAIFRNGLRPERRLDHAARFQQEGRLDRGRQGQLGDEGR